MTPPWGLLSLSPHFQHGLCLYLTHLYTCTPTLGSGGPSHCCTPVWGQQGHSGSPRVRSLGLSGHSALVGHQCFPYRWQTQSDLQLLRGQRKRGALCLFLSPGDPSTEPPLCSPSLLPISVMVQQNCLHPMGSPPPAGGAWAPACTSGHAEGFLGGFWHLLACWEGGPLGIFGISKHVEGKLLGSWHLQHVGGDVGVLPSGMWDVLRGSWHLQIRCGRCFGGSWDLHSCWGGSYGLSASSGLFGGGFGISSHLQVCPVSLGAPSIFRHVERTWGGLLAPPGVLWVSEGSCPLPCLSRMGTLSKLGA